MPRARKKPTAPACPFDQGAPAQFSVSALTLDPRAGQRRASVNGARSGLTYRQEVVEGQPGVTRKRRVHPLEALHRSGKITDIQRDVGLALVDAYERTLTSRADPFAPRVDASSNPSARAVRQVEKLDAWARLIAAVPRECLPVVLHVVCEGRAIRDGFAGDGHEAKAAIGRLVTALDHVGREKNHYRCTNDG